MSLNTIVEFYNSEVQRTDQRYFKNHPEKTHYIREHLESESDIDAPYVLVVKLSDSQRGRYPLATDKVSRQKIKQLKKSMKKSVQKYNRHKNTFG